MSDNKINKGKQGRIRVAANNPSEVEYLHQQFPGKTHKQIEDAVAACRTGSLACTSTILRSFTEKYRAPL